MRKAKAAMGMTVRTWSRKRVIPVPLVVAMSVTVIAVPMMATMPIVRDGRRFLGQ